MRTLERESVIKAPIEEVFSFFGKAENLNIITPPQLKFDIVTPLPITIKEGTIIDYKIKISGLSFNWRTKITEWEPPRRFIDIQTRGPYKMWVHEHTFIADGNKTIMKDKVNYISKGWFLEPLIQRFFVRKKVEDIFDYRQKKLSAIFKDDKQ